MQTGPSVLENVTVAGHAQTRVDAGFCHQQKRELKCPDYGEDAGNPHECWFQRYCVLLSLWNMVKRNAPPHVFDFGAASALQAPAHTNAFLLLYMLY